MRRELLAGALVLVATASLAAEPEALPPIAPLPQHGSPALSSGALLHVRELRLVGSSVLPEARVAEVLRPFTGRAVSTEDLIAARDAVTGLYRELGYVTSGVVLPDQTPADGVVELVAIEGTLEGVEVEPTRHFRRSHLRRRVRGPRGAPVRIQDLERRLQLLQRDPLVERIDAHLAPGSTRGRSRLRLSVEERSPWRLEASLANDAAASLGGLRGGMRLGHANLTGRGDALAVELARVHGLVDLDARYQMPLTAGDLRLMLGFRRSRSRIVEAPLQDLDIRSEQTTYSLELTHPLWRDRQGDWVAGIRGELRRSELRLLGERFSLLPAQVSHPGRSRISALRIFSDLQLRSGTRVLALRLQASVGLDVRGATIYPSRLPGSGVADGRFLAWRADLHWASRLDGWVEGAQLVARASAQLARDALLPMERISVGGSGSVRGYHQHELVRDSAFVASLELRVPVLRDPLGRTRLALAPFVDLGKAWNRDRARSLHTIASVGLGVRWRVGRRASLNAYWGSRLRQVDRRDGEGLQDAGVHVELRVAAF